MMTKYMEYRTIKDNLTIAFGKIVKEKFTKEQYNHLKMIVEIGFQEGEK